MAQGHAYTGLERHEPPRGSGMERRRGPIFELLRWIATHVRGFYAAVGAFLLIGLALILVAVVVFGTVAMLVSHGRTQATDDAILLWLNAHASPRLDVAALEVTALGGTVVVWMILLLSSFFLWSSRHHYSVALLWAALVGGSIVNSVLKLFFSRPRPHLFAWRTPLAEHSSFPSGHSMTAVVVYGTLAYLIARLQPTRTLRRLTLGFGLLVILLIGLSRLYLGVHYPSDVLAGFTVGLAWSTFCALGMEAMRYFRYRNPELPADEKDVEKGTAPIRDALKGDG